MMRLNDRVSILSAADMPVDGRNNPIPDWDNAAVTVEPATVTSLGSSENTVSQDHVTSSRLLILLPVTAARSDSRVLWRGDQYEIDGEVVPQVDARGRIHHHEATLRRVSG